MYNESMEKKKIKSFDLKYAELELARRELVAKLEREELAAKVVAFTAKAKRNAKKAAKMAAYDAKYLYVAGGHAKNEFLGFLTIFNAGRSTKVRATRLVRYDENDKKLYLDYYERKDRNHEVRSKVFVYIHGGGWIGGLPETREAFTTKVAEAGYFVVSVMYGDAPVYGHPKPIENVYKAFAWIKENAEKFNIDAEEIFVGGESAGAHLSAMAGAISTNDEYKAQFDLDGRSHDQKIKALVLNCGVYDLEKALDSGFRNIKIYVQSYCCGTAMEDTTEEYRKQISPIYWVNEKFPPAYVISAENDKLAVMTFDLVKKLYDVGVPVAHYHGEGRLAVHAFAVVQILKISKEAMKGIKAFLSSFGDK